MDNPSQDIWSQWLLKRRFGGDPERMQKMLEHLYPIRDQVLSHLHLEPGQSLLDVGCGDGLIGFGALEKFPACRVIFSDISEDLLRHAEALAREMRVSERCTFLRASADDLSALGDGSVEAVTTRSVLIYVSAKQQAFHEFQRVLRQGGELSIFEPINNYAFPERLRPFWGYDVSPVADLAQRVEAVFEKLQPLASDPMLDFDERDLLAQAFEAGFREIQLDLSAWMKPPEEGDWTAFLNTPGNPRIPSLAEAMQQTLAPEEIERFTAHLRPLVEVRQGVYRLAVAYLWATK